VPTYRRAGNLKDLLERMAPLLGERPHIRLCVVNDGSHDAAYEQVVAPHAAWFDYRILPVNGGCGAARRACFEGATEDYLVCIDDDCLPTKDWLDWLEAMIEANPGIDLFAGDVRPSFTKPPTLLQRALSVVDDAPSPLITDHGLLTAVTANLAMKRTIYEASGGFSEDLRGGEDCDLTQSLLAVGATYLVSLDWTIRHIAKSSYREMRKRFRGYGRHAAHLTVSRRHWRLGAAQSDGSLRQIARLVRTKFNDEFSQRRNRKLPASERWLRASIYALLMLEYELGWRAGLRGLGVRSEIVMPQPPALADRFVDFTEDDAAAIVLR
jgi:glycosyltransferase involved in cell wall biosynthesis